MAATKAELLLAEPPACVPPPLSPLDGYSKLEELRLLLQNAAAGGSLLAAEAAGMLCGELGEQGGEELAVPVICSCPVNDQKKKFWLLICEKLGCARVAVRCAT